MEASAETEWPILLQHGTLHDLADLRGSQQNCRNFRMQLLRQNQESFSSLKHYRPFRFTNCASKSSLAARLAVRSLAGLYLLTGSQFAQAESLSLLCGNAKGTIRVDVDTIQLTVKERFENGSVDDFQNGRVSFEEDAIIKFRVVEKVVINDSQIGFGYHQECIETKKKGPDELPCSYYNSSFTGTIDRYTGTLMRGLGPNLTRFQCSAVESGRQF